MMNNIEEYKNQVELLRQALKFYENAGNWLPKPPINSIISPIELDCGSQARFALEQLKKVEEANQKMEADYNRVIGETITAIENHPFDLGSMIRTIKNIEDDNNI